MSDDFESEIRRFQQSIEAHVQRMEDAVRRHEAAMQQAVHRHQEEIERTCREFERKFPGWPMGPWRSRGRKRRTDPDGELGGVPVKPNNPKGLSGGAAASIDTND